MKSSVSPVACVTGADGFIGRQLVPELILNGYSVRVLSRKAVSQYHPNVFIYQGDLCGPVDALVDFVDNADVLFHCAGELRASDRLYQVNVDGTRRLIAAASGRLRRWVHLSSIGVYGQVAEGRVDELSALNPSNPYETTKAIADLLLFEAAAKNSFELVILRPSNVYGPGMRSTYLFALHRLVRKGLFFFIGPPGASATLVHVRDVVRALLLCAGKPQAVGNIYNLSGNDTIENLIGCIAKIENVAPPRLRLPILLMKLIAFTLGHIPGFPITPSRLHALTTRVYYESSKLKRELGYDPLIDLTSGIAGMHADHIK